MCILHDLPPLLVWISVRDQSWSFLGNQTATWSSCKDLNLYGCFKNAYPHPQALLTHITESWEWVFVHYCILKAKIKFDKNLTVSHCLRIIWWINSCKLMHLNKLASFTGRGVPVFKSRFMPGHSHTNSWSFYNATAQSVMALITPQAVMLYVHVNLKSTIF